MELSPEVEQILLQSIESMRETQETIRKENREDHQNMFNRLSSVELAIASAVTKEECERCKEKAKQEQREKEISWWDRFGHIISFGLFVLALITFMADLAVRLLG